MAILKYAPFKNSILYLKQMFFKERLCGFMVICIGPIWPCIEYYDFEAYL
jgi:hypothetical protein